MLYSYHPGTDAQATPQNTAQFRGSNVQLECRLNSAYLIYWGQCITYPGCKLFYYGADDNKIQPQRRDENNKERYTRYEISDKSIPESQTIQKNLRIIGVQDEDGGRY